MAESKRYAIVTGSNKGIGFEICRQLASNGIVVVLTARDEKKGIEATEKLKKQGLSDYVMFHQLDVTSSSSIASLADFVKTQFGKLDILVNNAAINGVVAAEGTETRKDWYEFAIQTYDLAKECLETNYYGTKRMVEAFISLLQLSDSPRIVNVSSSLGKLESVFQNERGKWAKQVLGDADNLTEEKIEGVLDEFLKDFKEGCVETKGWPALTSAYRVSKAAVNAYTRVLAKKYPNIRINCVCPGYVKTEFNHYCGVLSVEEGAASPVKVALGPADGPSGVFFIRDEMSSF